MVGFDLTDLNKQIKADMTLVKEGLSHLDRGGGRVHITDFRKIENDKVKMKALEKLMLGENFIDKHGYIQFRNMVDRIAVYRSGELEGKEGYAS